MSTDNRIGIDSLTAVALAAPDRVAVIDDRPGAPARTLTYHELNRCVNRMANGLRDVGVQPGDKIMWLGQNSIEVVAFSHAARKVGAVSVPLDYRLADDEFDFVINDSDSILIYADVVYADMLQRLQARTPKLAHTVIFAGPGPADPDGRPVGMHPGQTAEVDFCGDEHEPPPSPAPSKVMIYTSGTTGKPKGAVRNPSAGGGQIAGLVGLLGYRPDNAAPWPFALKEAYVGNFPPESLWEVYELDGWHMVGDVAYFDEEGFYYICDRKKDMIITGGMNVYPAEVEAALERHHKVFEVAVLGVPSDEWGERVLAVVVPHQPEPGHPALTVDELDEIAYSHLAGFKAPSEYRFVDEIPKTGSNKILKREPRERFAKPAA
jgi:acyl-CoA synthetase (AMP-forming)/AMP-acid ligase II